MFQTCEPLFEKHTVLRAKALNDTLRGALETVNQIYADYSDGIVKELEMEQQMDYLVIKSGMLLYRGRLYYLEKEISLKLPQNNTKQIVKIRFLEMQNMDGIKKYSTDVYMDENEVARNDELELCRFQYQVGAKLRNDYTSFKDMSAGYNIINVLNAQYAAPGGSTISTLITKRFSDEMLEKNLTDAFDISFCLECQRMQPISKKVILSYLSHKSGSEKKDLDNQHIYQELQKILDSEGNRRPERAQAREQRMIII